MSGHGPLLQIAGHFMGLESCKRDLFPSSTRRSATSPNGTEGCAIEVAQTQEDRGRRVRGEEKDLEREKGRESTEKKKWEERRRGETPWREEDVIIIAETASRKT